MRNLVCSVWNIQALNTHLESLLFQLVGCSQEIGSERMLDGREAERNKETKCSILNTEGVQKASFPVSSVDPKWFTAIVKENGLQYIYLVLILSICSQAVWTMWSESVVLWSSFFNFGPSIFSLTLLRCFCRLSFGYNQPMEEFSDSTCVGCGNKQWLNATTQTE